MIQKITIITGGQSGVDRAAMDFVLENPQLKIKCGGFCPKGRKAEDGIIPQKYPLIECETDNYAVRTELNVKNSDGVLIIFKVKINDPGTTLTVELAKKHNKPLYLCNIKQNNINEIRKWISENAINTLNIAGPRLSNDPEIYELTYDFLVQLFLV
jgi:hypothetical protein